MPVTTTYFEVRDPSQVGQEFQQTPIYIGTATKRVVVPVKPGVFSLAIPQAAEGFRFREDIFESEVKYWRIYSKATISLISPERFSVELSGQDLSYESSMQDLAKCNLFIVWNNALVFCSPIHSLEYKIIDNKIYIQDLSVLEPLPTILPTMDCILAAPSVMSNVPYHIFNNLIILESLPNQLEINNFNTLFYSNYNLYYDVIDYRWVRLTVTDTIPDEFLYNPYNKLGLAAVLHRRISNADMTLFSVPIESLGTIEKVLEEVSMAPGKYGYAVVPLWTNSMVNNFIHAYVRSLESNFIGFQVAYLPSSLLEKKKVLSNTHSIGEITIFNGGYGFNFGQTYGQASD